LRPLAAAARAGPGDACMTTGAASVGLSLNAAGSATSILEWKPTLRRLLWPRNTRRASWKGAAREQNCNQSSVMPVVVVFQKLP
jgi:hypothetical protein